MKVKGIKVNCISTSDVAAEAYVKYFPEDTVGANTPEQVAKLVAEVAEKDEKGKFWMIKKGMDITHKWASLNTIGWMTGFEPATARSTIWNSNH